MAEERVEERAGAGRASAEDEIRLLEQRLEERKRELAQRGTAEQPEKEVFREVVREHIESVAPGIAALPASHVRPSPRSDAANASARDDALQDLVAQALSGTIADAVDKASRESPYLLDALHDRLVDEYYDKLLALRKIDAW